MSREFEVHRIDFYPLLDLVTDEIEQRRKAMGIEDYPAWDWYLQVSAEMGLLAADILGGNKEESRVHIALTMALLAQLNYAVSQEKKQ